MSDASSQGRAAARGGPLLAADVVAAASDDSQSAVVIYDPGLKHTAVCRSAITKIDGESGALFYRGYPIEMLAKSMDFLDVAYLLCESVLPTMMESSEWSKKIAREREVSVAQEAIVQAFPEGCDPMALLISLMASFETINQPVSSSKCDMTLLPTALMSKLPVFIAMAYHRSMGTAFPGIPTAGSYVGGFLDMVLGPDSPQLTNPASRARAEAIVNMLLVLHADHGQNCSTMALRTIASSGASLSAALAGACAALSGPLHGGASTAVHEMLTEIGNVKHVPQFLEMVKSKRARLMGFGNRLYRTYDPRALVIRDEFHRLFSPSDSPLAAVAMELERVALEDEYFLRRRLYPNIDYYTSIMYPMLGFHPSIFTMLFALGRLPGWLANWREQMGDPDQSIVRPQQVTVDL